MYKSKYLLLEIYTFRSFENEAFLTIFRELFRSLISNDMFEVTIRVLRDHQFQFSFLSADEGGSVQRDSGSCPQVRLIEQSWD